MCRKTQYTLYPFVISFRYFFVCTLCRRKQEAAAQAAQAQAAQAAQQRQAMMTGQIPAGQVQSQAQTPAALGAQVAAHAQNGVVVNGQLMQRPPQVVGGQVQQGKCNLNPYPYSNPSLRLMHVS